MSTTRLSRTESVRQVFIGPSLEAWREAARTMLQSGVSPESIDFIDTETPATSSLFNAEPPALSAAAQKPNVPAEFLRRAKVVACHRNLTRWNVLYRLLWRLQTNRNLLRITVDEDVLSFRKLEHQVQRDLHKMHAFVRFRRVETPDGEAYIAWYQPDHFILPLAAPFFAERFAVMRWSILTPHASMHWDPATRQIEFSPGVPREMAPQADELEDLWRTYYGSIYNPARTNLTAMRNEMPVRYWKNLPEIESMPNLLAEAPNRVAAMIKQQSTLNAESFVPKEHALPVLREAIPACKGCELYACATQAVFGSGPVDARIVVVGEQPGDEEDRLGEPFVGPAGRLLDELLVEAGIDRKTTYVTNAVKHFKFTLRGNHRLHENPRISEINACRPWLLAELDAIQPNLVICLGASASKSLLGAKFALMKDRGKLISSPYADRVIATLHPSAILRAPDAERREAMRATMLADLRLAKATAS
jgi:probable DNA metabolism protein